LISSGQFASETLKAGLAFGSGELFNTEALNSPAQPNFFLSCAPFRFRPHQVPVNRMKSKTRIFSSKNAVAKAPTDATVGS